MCVLQSLMTHYLCHIRLSTRKSNKKGKKEENLKKCKKNNLNNQNIKIKGNRKNCDKKDL